MNYVNRKLYFFPKFYCTLYNSFFLIDPTESTTAIVGTTPTTMISSSTTTAKGDMTTPGTGSSTTVVNAGNYFMEFYGNMECQTVYDRFSLIM